MKSVVLDLPCTHLFGSPRELSLSDGPWPRVSSERKTHGRSGLLVLCWWALTVCAGAFEGGPYIPQPAIVVDGKCRAWWRVPSDGRAKLELQLRGSSSASTVDLKRFSVTDRPTDARRTFREKTTIRAGLSFRPVGVCDLATFVRGAAA